MDKLKAAEIISKRSVCLFSCSHGMCPKNCNTCECNSTVEEVLDAYNVALYDLAGFSIDWLKEKTVGKEKES